MFMVKFSPTALNFDYDFVLSVHFLGHPVHLFSYFSSPTSCSARAEACSHNIPLAGRLLHLLFTYFACSYNNIPAAGRLLHLLFAYFVHILHILHFLRVLIILHRLVASCICSYWQLPNNMISCAVRSGGKPYDQTL